MRPANPRGKLFVRLLFAITLAVLIFFAGRYFLLSQIRQALHDRLGDIREKGIVVNFDSAKINTWSGNLTLYGLGLRLTNAGDSARHQITADIPVLSVQGINIIPFLTNRKLSINHIRLESPVITYRPSAQLPNRETRNKFFEDLHIDDIEIAGIQLHWKDSLQDDTLATIQTDLRIQKLGLERMGDSLAWRESSVIISNTSFVLPGEYYAFAVKDIRLDLQKRKFEVDSIQITPTLSRRAFMVKYGKEIDYFKGSVPYIKVSGLTMRADNRLNIRMKSATLNLKLSVFRDKRYPFIKDFYTTLPSEFLHRLPFRLTIDTLLLKDSFVSYEEYPAEGDSSGAVFFDHLYATAYDVGNDSTVADTRMQARAKFMGTGNLLVNFTFPRDTLEPYTVAGWLRKFPLVKLNDMLGPAAKARVESGMMTNLEFHFKYNSTRSDGSIELNYEDLKISSLRKDKNEKAKVSLIKTLLLNLFVIKKDMDEDVKDAKKTGTILFYRNTKRSIFNYWWKSVFSGIKSAYNLDRFQPKPPKENNDDDKGKKKKRTDT